VERLSLKTAKGKDLSVGTRAAIASTVAVIEDLRRRYPIARVDVACKAHTVLPLYYEIMRTVEAAYAAGVERGDQPRDLARLRKARFSLLPNKSGFTVSSMPICGRTMMAVLTRVDDGKGAKLARFKGADSGHDDAWRKHANVNKVETRSRAFGGRISTDGYAVSVHMASTQANLLSTTNVEWDGERIERERHGKPVQYCGVDPGFTDVVTVAHTRELHGLQPGSDKSVPATVTSYSSSRYAEAAKLKASARRTGVWNEETADEVASLELETDRSTVQGLSAFTRSYLAVYRTLLLHRATRGYRAMRFTRYVFKQQTVSAICDLRLQRRRLRRLERRERDADPRYPPTPRSDRIGRSEDCKGCPTFTDGGEVLICIKRSRSAPTEWANCRKSRKSVPRICSRIDRSSPRRSASCVARNSVQSGATTFRSQYGCCTGSLRMPRHVLPESFLSAIMNSHVMQYEYTRVASDLNSLSGRVVRQLLHSLPCTVSSCTHSSGSALPAQL